MAMDVLLQICAVFWMWPVSVQFYFAWFLLVISKVTTYLVHIDWYDYNAKSKINDGNLWDHGQFFIQNSNLIGKWKGSIELQRILLFMAKNIQTTNVLSRIFTLNVETFSEVYMISKLLQVMIFDHILWFQLGKTIFKYYMMIKTVTSKWKCQFWWKNVAWKIKKKRLKCDEENFQIKQHILVRSVHKVPSSQNKKDIR